MIALHHNDAAQNNYEASIKCLQNKSHSTALPKNTTNIEKLPQSQTMFHDPKHLSCNEILESSEECTQRAIYNHEITPWFANPDVNYVPQWKLYPLHGQAQPFIMNYPFQYAPQNMFPSSYPYEYHQFQDFQYFVVIDFEATCDREKIPNPQEIIEFPSVIVSSISGQLEACFQTYVRPTCNQVLSDFCRELTGIQQIQVDRGVTLSEALLRHDKWLEKRGIKNSHFAIVTWSDWDCRVMLESECRYKKIQKPPYFNRWINLRVPFHQVFGGTRCNLKEAVEMAGLTWQGRPHCGLDDAKNTAHLLALLMHKGFKFSITNSLTCPLNNDGSFTMLNPAPEKPLYAPFQPHKDLEQQVVTYQHHYCYCGVKSSKRMIKKPGPKQGSAFFGCGNWTVNRGARCQYFEWADQ